MFLLVPAYPGSPVQKAVKRLCVCVYTVLNGDIANDREFRQSPQITSILYFGSSFIYAMTEARVFKF